MINGVQQTPIEGTSMVYTFDDAKAPTRHKTQYFELLANRGVYHDGWMANTTPLRLPWAKPAPGVASPDPDDFKWELYNVAEDFSQANDLAAEEPREAQGASGRLRARGEEVQRLSARCVVRRACRRAPSSEPHTRAEHVHLLSRDDPRSRGYGSGHEEQGLHHHGGGGDSGKGGADGVLITQGGRFGGWVLLIRDGKPEFDYAFSNQKQHKYRVALEGQARAGQAHDQVRFQVRRPRLSARAATARSRWTASRSRRERSNTRSLSASRSTRRLDVGEDTGTPVVEDYVDKMPFKFTGDLKKVVVELGKSGLAAADEKRLEETRIAVAAVRD